MSQPTINPYQPASSSAGSRAAGTAFIFDGVIEEIDYAQLYPNRDLLAWLQAVVLLITSLLVTAVVVAFLISERKATAEVAVSLLVLVVVMVTLSLALRVLARRGRSQTHLKKYPDLLGIARGKLTPDGLVFNDGKRTHWFGPVHLLRAACLRKGIRVPLDNDPYRYLPLTARLWNSYSAPGARKLKREWKRKASHSRTTERMPGQDLWFEVSRRPEDAVPFAGDLTLQHPTRTLAARNAGLVETASSVATVVIACFFWNGDPRYALGIVAVGVLLAATTTITWVNYFRGIRYETIQQQGWVNESELAWCNGLHGVRLLLTEMVACQALENLVSLTTAGGSQFFIPREHVRQTAHWQLLTARLGGAESGNVAPDPPPPVATG